MSCGATALHAQELEPRSYTNVPIDQTFIVLGAARSDGDLSPAPTSTLRDAELTIDSAVLGFAHSFALAGDSAKFDLTLTRSCYDGSATFEGEQVSGGRCEYGDPRVRLTWNFYGAPAMGLKEYAAWQPGLVVGASLQATIPVGSYSEDQLINAGSNRWMLRPGIGMSYARGRWHIDAVASVRWYEDNDEFFRGTRLEQEPVYALQSHLIYNFDRGRWLSLNANFYRGGETINNGVRADDYLENSRWGVTFSTPLNRHHSLKFYASTGVLTRVGGDFDTYGVAWQLRL